VSATLVAFAEHAALSLSEHVPASPACTAAVNATSITERRIFFIISSITIYCFCCNKKLTANTTLTPSTAFRSKAIQVVSRIYGTDFRLATAPPAPENRSMSGPDPLALAQRIEEHLFGHLLPFWCGPAIDHQNGGWHAWLTNDLRPDRTKPKGLIVNTRILWAFSAVSRIRKDPQFTLMADRALEVVTQRFWDPDFGGGFWQLSDTFSLLDPAKKTYGQAFYIYALTEYYRTFGAHPSLVRAVELYRTVDAAAHDNRFGGYVEVCQRDWQPADSNRLSEKDMDEKKSMNNHLHVLEAFTNLYRIWPESSLQARLLELVGLFERCIIDGRSWHLHHFFDERWQVRSDSYTFGHDIEASWLLWEAAEVLRDPVLTARLRPVCLRLAEAALREGVDASGALMYEGRNGSIIDPGRECWPQAEALVGFINAFQLSGNDAFLHAAERVWHFIETKLADRTAGEWFWRIEADGAVNQHLPKVSEWKGPYHGTRACLEALSRLRRIA
jgi:mannobiose 2-epimerase